MSLVLDASMTLSWLFSDEQTETSRNVLATVTQEGAVVPALWRLEVANALQSAVRRKRIAVADRDACLGDLTALRIAIDPETDTHAWGETLRLAEAHSLSVYDAAYLELARRRGLPIATLDADLADAARAHDLEVIGSP